MRKYIENQGWTFIPTAKDGRDFAQIVKIMQITVKFYLTFSFNKK